MVWQAKLGAHEDSRNFFGIVRCVSLDGMDIAPGTLYWVVEEDGMAAAGLEQAIRGLHTPGCGVGGIPCGRQGGRDLPARVLVPDILLRLRMKQGELPIVDADNPEYPGT